MEKECGKTTWFFFKGKWPWFFFLRSMSSNYAHLFFCMELFAFSNLSFLLYVPCPSLHRLQIKDSPDLEPLFWACPFWLWVTNNAEFTRGSSFSSVSQTDHFNQSYKLNTRTYSPPSTVSQGFKQRWWHSAGTSRVPWEITWQGGSLAFAGQEVYCLPLKKQNSRWFADTL